MVAMFILMIFPGAGLWGLLSNVLGGGVAESFLYPIYGGLILLAGLIVGCTVLILEEMRSLKDKIDRLKLLSAHSYGHNWNRCPSSVWGRILFYVQSEVCGGSYVAT